MALKWRPQNECKTDNIQSKKLFLQYWKITAYSLWSSMWKHLIIMLGFAIVTCLLSCYHLWEIAPGQIFITANVVHLSYYQWYTLSHIIMTATREGVTLRASLMVIRCGRDSTDLGINPSFLITHPHMHVGPSRKTMKRATWLQLSIGWKGLIKTSKSNPSPIIVHTCTTMSICGIIMIMVVYKSSWPYSPLCRQRVSCLHQFL